jgi:hypothetical protein
LAADELEQLDCLTLVEPSRAPHRSEAWQVRAAKPTAVAELDSFCAEIKAIALRFDGHYDGWDSGWLDVSQLPRLLGGSGISVDDVQDGLDRRSSEEHGFDL